MNYKLHLIIFIYYIVYKWLNFLAFLGQGGAQSKKKHSNTSDITKMVGKTGFEPATPWSQTKCSTKLSHFPLLVRPIGVEPITFWSVVKRSIQLIYERRTYRFFILKWWLRLESNQRHKDFQSFALPTELRSHKNGGPDENRTRDLLRDRQTW